MKSVPFALRRIALVMASSSVALAVPLQGAPTVEVTLSSNTTTVGVPVDLQIEIQGTREARVPGEIPVDGLEIVHVGQQQQFNLINGRFDARTVHTYRVTPRREGTFQIPEILVETEGRKLRTPKLSLAVQAGGAPPKSGSPADDDLRRMVFGELVVPKEKVHVGELIPVEMRVFLDPRVRAQAEAGPRLQSDGFTQKPFGRAREAEQDVDGRRYRVTVFQTHVTPAKAGSLELGPAELPAIVQLPSPQAYRTDPFADFFNDPFFNDPFRRMEQRRIRITTGTARIDVRPLPSAERPPSFSGAVGHFEARIDASPREGRVGDPITLRISVSGQGDFDRVQAPVPDLPPGWKSYPATSNFTADNEAQTSGTKTFELVLVPEITHSTTPPMEFSFFDPEPGRYVTIPLPPLALNLSQAPAATTLPASPAPNAPRTETAAESAPTQPSDLLDILRDPGPAVPADRVPWIDSKAFVLFHACAALVALILLVGGLLRHRLTAPASQQRRSLERARNEAMAKVQTTTGPEQLEAAIAALSAAAAVKRGGAASTLEPAALADTLARNEADRDWIREVFRTRDRIRFGGGGSATPPPDLTRRIHELLRG